MDPQEDGTGEPTLSFWSLYAPEPFPGGPPEPEPVALPLAHFPYLASEPLLKADGNLVWASQDLAGSYDLWRSDGTAAGTQHFVLELPPVPSPAHLTA